MELSQGVINALENDWGVKTQLYGEPDRLLRFSGKAPCVSLFCDVISWEWAHRRKRIDWVEPHGKLVKLTVVATPRAVVSVACWWTATHRAQGPPKIAGSVCVHVAFWCLTCQVWGIPLGAFAVVEKFPAFFMHLCLHKENKLLDLVGVLRGPRIGGQWRERADLHLTVFMPKIWSFFPPK